MAKSKSLESSVFELEKQRQKAHKKALAMQSLMVNISPTNQLYQSRTNAGIFNHYARSAPNNKVEVVSFYQPVTIKAICCLCPHFLYYLSLYNNSFGLLLGWHYARFSDWINEGGWLVG